MSAAEKLKVLNEASALEKYEIDLVAVLPQIVALVEAATTVNRWCPRCDGSGQEPESGDLDDSPNPWVKVSCDLCGDMRAALTALDVALTVDGKK